MRTIKLLFQYYLLMIAIFFSGRILLFAIYFSRFKDSDANYWLTFIYGLRLDTIVSSMMLIIPLSVLTFTSPSKRSEKAGNYFLKLYFLLISAIHLFIEYATFPFFAEYDVRPNYLFVEYLVYPKEVINMLLASHKIEISIGLIIIGCYIYWFFKFIKIDIKPIISESYIKRFLIFIPVALILFIGIRSSLGHRPANISDAMYSSSRVVNEITKNSIYSVCYAVYSNKKNKSNVRSQYGKMNLNESLQRVKKRLNIESLNELSPLSRVEKSNFKSEKTKNLVIFIQESLGYQFVSSIGGEQGITPNFNKLSSEGILFNNAFSTGTRSIRGIAGCVSGIFPVPGEGVVKRNKSQQDFFTIASLLKPFGYHTLFFYGGESRFDNMRGWFLGNGFDQIIDEPEFVNPEFKGTWGVSDGDVVKRANEEFIKLYGQKQKFAAVMFSTSNHDPFDFPGNKIDLIPGEPKKSVKNAVKYADFAIGDFIDLAKKEAYYKDTVFVIIADHNVRVYGNDIVPVKMFHIPALIIGGDIKPYVYEQLATQPDVLATALDLTGLDLNHPVMGHSIFSNKKQEVAFMQYNDTYALRAANKIAVIRPHMKPLTFIYGNEYLKPASHDKELEKDTLAFIITLDNLYNNKLYR